MKKVILSTLAVLLFTSNGYADSCSNPNPEYLEQLPCQKMPFYVKATSGINFLHVKSLDFQKGYLLTAALGYKFFCGARIEAEYGYRRNQSEFKGYRFVKGHFITSSVMINGLWDVPLYRWFDCGVQPFIGGGLGCNFERYSIMNTIGSVFKTHQHKNHFAWQVIVGFDVPLLKRLDFTFEYKLMSPGESTHLNNSIAVGLTYYLN